MLFFAYFSVSKEKDIKWSPNGMKTFGNVIFGTNVIQRTWSGFQAINEEATRQGDAPAPLGAPPPSWAPRSSPDRPLLPIYTHIPWKHQNRSQNHFSTTATFCTHEIPSGDLFWRSAGGGFDHGGLLHQHHDLSDEA